MRDREILQIALGSPACEVTAHLLNLQGLGATGDYEDGAACRATVTHRVANRMWVPRALLVDAPDRIHRPRAAPPSEHVAGAWSGKVESLSMDALRAGGGATTPSAASLVDPVLQSFRETSNILSTSQFSRYYVEPSNSESAQPTYAASVSNSRHVDWDDMDDEKDEEDEQEQEDRKELLRRQRRQWQGGTLPPLQEKMDQFWGSLLEPKATKQEAAPATKSDSPPQLRADDLLWTDYLAPPLHPQSILGLPRPSEGWDTYFPSTSGGDLSEWTEDNVLERIRTMLEDCDSCQGCVVSSSGFGVFAGLATQVLHYLQDECPSASRVVLSYEDSVKAQASLETPPEGGEDASWRTRNVEQTRSFVNKASAWHDFWECAHVILPMRLRNDQPSRFHASALTAAALEASMLPFRARPNDRLRIGMNSYYYGSLSGDSDFGSVPSLSLSEYLGILKPREKLSVLEMDGLTESTDPLWPSLVEGTSIERDRRMRESPHLVGTRRPHDVLPGRWLLDPSEGGRLTSFSHSETSSRALHQHFALMTSVRPSQAGAAKLNEYVDAMMQGMGIRFRPEQSAAAVLDQSLGSLTAGGYGAGSYWRSIHKNQPVLSMMGNTTRFYPKAHAIASNMKMALSPRSRGYYNRDVEAGVLPEIEDCQEVLSSMWDLRDMYQPPEGSGLVIDEEGEFMGW
jgi:hypothetical protein